MSAFLYLFFVLRRLVADNPTLAPSLFFELRRLADDISPPAQDLFFVLRRLADDTYSPFFLILLAKCRFLCDFMPKSLYISKIITTFAPKTDDK